MNKFPQRTKLLKKWNFGNKASAYSMCLARRIATGLTRKRRGQKLQKRAELSSDDEGLSDILSPQVCVVSQSG